MSFTIVIPFYNGETYIDRLLDSIPTDLKVIVVDDLSAKPYETERVNVTVFRMESKGYFTGAVNYGINLCDNDVLILNQDTWFTGVEWLKLIATNVKKFGMFGERTGKHPAWPSGYIHGVWMYVTRKTINTIGLMDAATYPLWGSTCEWQLRAARAGIAVNPIRTIPDLHHSRRGNFGSSIASLLKAHPEKQEQLIRTPPEISVLVPCYNHGRYLPDLVNSLVGGATSLGEMKQQSFASFEVIIVDDKSTDDSLEWCKKVASPFKGVSYVALDKNVGTAAALNVAAAASHGKYLTVLNADDMRETHSLEHLYQAQLLNPHSFIYDNIVAFNAGKLRPDIKLGVSAYDFEAMLHQNHVHTGIMLPKTAWTEVGGWPEIMNDGREDWAMNVRLGVNGYCGKLIPTTGYYYRREGQNRTLTNTTPAKREQFLAKIVSLYPNIYKGERPPMCCGNSNTKRTANRAAARAAAATSLKAAAAPAPASGFVTLEYIGGNFGSQSWYGPVTHTRYTAGKAHRFVTVDLRDLHSDNAGTPGMLDYRQGGRPVFKRLA